VADKKLITVTTKSPEAKAAFLKAWDLWDNGRTTEALAGCKQAVAADAEFALAQACVGVFTTGAAGQGILDKAAQLAAKLPDAERLLIEGWAALRDGDATKYDADMKKVAEAAPDDVRAHMWAARAPFQARDFAGAEAEYKKALALNPAAGFVYAQLAIVQMEQKKYDDALASAKSYVAASPTEPAAQRALGDALLHLDKVTDAEAAFAKAVELGPTVLGAYNDLAVARTILGNYAGARDALDKGKAADAEPGDAIDRRANMAWVSFVEGKDKEALATLDAAEKDAETQSLPAAWHPANTRAYALWIEGKNADAIKAADAALAKCDTRAQSSTIEKSICRLSFIHTKAFAQLATGNVADAQGTVALYQGEAKKLPTRAWIQLQAGMLSDAVTALQQKDPRGPAALLARCPPDDSAWKLAILRMADKTLADPIKQDLAGKPAKDFGYALIVKGLKK
jgi:Flp pilus assembly protein TadD